VNDNNIVLYDGVCNFCNSSVQFIIRHDKTNSLKFASLQSPVGQQLLAKHSIPKEVDSVIFIEGDKAYIKSEAAFKLLNYFGSSWKMLKVFSVLPVFFRNFFYDLFAKNRYKMFGKQETCMLPSPEIRARFMDV
jgi:predicted DCC family thiol-disulfide oxidoreductase YuxK